jgi:hypothetical protein
MRWNQITEAGEFVAAPRTAQETPYITMTQTRMGFVSFAFGVLAKALTTAIRCSAVRKQGHPAPGLPETTILD